MSRVSAFVFSTCFTALTLHALTLPAHAAAPTITSFTPTSGPVGTNPVTITGTGFTSGSLSVKFNGTSALTKTFVNSTTVTAKVPSDATTGPISVTATGGTATSVAYFYLPPTVGTVTSGAVGAVVTIPGTNFTGATVVTFNGTSASNFTVVSNTSITATVPEYATTGKISVTTPGGTATSSGNFTVNYDAPTITSFTPVGGVAGTTPVTITGTGFVSVLSLAFNGTNAPTFTVDSNTSITVTVPISATSGIISVTTPGGTATSVSFGVYVATSLQVNVTAGDLYAHPRSGITLNYILSGPQYYTGTLPVGGGEITDIMPGSYHLTITGGHWLKRTITGITVDGVNVINTSLANGDADGGNSVNLFDFTVLDSKFRSVVDTMADLDGDGHVNLMDYVIIDKNFGALGDTNNPVDGAEMVWVPAGDFTMGDDAYQTSQYAHTVTLDGFWMYKYEVTVAQYRQFCTATARAMPTAPTGGWLEDHPIVNVNWADATAYCTWAGMSLPTEAQWEKAARSADTRLYPWGDTWDETKCTNGTVSVTSSRPVGSFPAGVSPYGCMDMAGNVEEWCSDWWKSGYTDEPTINPTGPTTGTNSYKVVRGGGWNSIAMDSFQCARRAIGYSKAAIQPYRGFRCAKTP